MNDMDIYSIKETSELTGIAVDTLRYYEKISLLPRADRKPNSHRIYRDDDIQTLKLIACLKKTGMSLDEMKPFLSLTTRSDLMDFPELHDRIVNHKRKIESQIASLQEVVEFIDSKLIHGEAVPQNCTLTGDSSRKLPVRKP